MNKELLSRRELLKLPLSLLVLTSASALPSCVERKPRFPENFEIWPPEQTIEVEGDIFHYPTTYQFTFGERIERTLISMEVKLGEESPAPYPKDQSFITLFLLPDNGHLCGRLPHHRLEIAMTRDEEEKTFYIRRLSGEKE